MSLDKFPPTNSEVFTLREITSINHKPHPYMIGPRHVTIASDMFNGMLGQSAIDYCDRVGINCADRGCQLKSYEHTSDKVLALTVKSRETNLNNIPGLHAYLLSIKPLLEEQKLDGIIFVQG